MASIVKLQRKNGIVYKAIIKHKGSHLKSKTFTRKTDATAWAKRVEGDQELIESLGSPGSVMRFGDLIDEYLAQWTGKCINQATRAAYWNDAFGKYRLTDVTAEMIRKQLRTLESSYCTVRQPSGEIRKLHKKPSGTTVNRYRTVLSAVFKYAILEGYMTVNPVSRVAARKSNNQRTRFLSDQERGRLLDACKNAAWDKLYLLVLMAMTTGMRKAELTNLRWCHVDFSTGLAYLADTKNGEERYCPVPGFVMAELAKIRQVGNGLIFPSDIKPERPFEFKKHWFKALKDAGIESFRWHDLRHTAASLLVMNGATLYEAGQVLGHKSVQTTQRYAHLSTDHKAELVNRVMTKAVKL